MEFDELKRAWGEFDRKLDIGFHLNTRRLRSSIRGNSDTPLNRMPRCQIDYSAPVVIVQRQRESLSIERRRTKNWMLRLAPLAFTVLVIVGIKSLFRVDLYSILGTAGLAVPVVLGLLVVLTWIKQFFLVTDFDGEEIVGRLTTLLRVRRRHRVLRG